MITDKEFWERCGFIYKDEPFTNDSGHKGIGRTFYYPNGEVQGYSTRAEGLPIYPTLDLNNLFKYAVPIVHNKLGDKACYDLMCEWVQDIIFDNDPALALYRAICEVINAETNQ